MYFDRDNIMLQQIEDSNLQNRNVQLTIARLDLLHPIVSGNKFYKLFYFLQKAANHHCKKIQTFGGAYSNHLAATAYATQAGGLESTGMVRGEEPSNLSLTLQQCKANGMQLHFLPRKEYKEACLHFEANSNLISIPEGGYHPLGAKGAALIYEDAALQNATHICLAMGTATTLAGILQKASMYQNVIAVPVLKGMNDIEERLLYLNGQERYSNLKIWDEYHFGGYAKTNESLLQFMNFLYQQYKLPTDIVYTSKLMYALMEKIEQNYFPAGSRIVCIHTGGLQGNCSLPKNSLIF